MDWGPIWPIDNFKGHKVKKKLALAGLGAPSEITFEPIEIKVSNLGNQCMFGKYHFEVEGHKIQTQKIGQILAQKIVSTKKSSKM